MRFHLNLSVDHTDEAKHDYIRGKQNAYRKMLETFDAVQPLHKRFPNLILHTLTTVMKENQDDIFDIYEELKRRFQPDGISMNYCRGNPLDPSQTEVDREIYEKLAARLEADYQSGSLPARQLLRVRVRQPSAGPTCPPHGRPYADRAESSVLVRLGPLGVRVIYSNGDVVECEIKNSSLGNLRDVDYDFGKLWFNDRAKEVADEAANGCFCTHECGHYSSAIYSLPTVVKIAIEASAARRPFSVGDEGP